MVKWMALVHIKNTQNSVHIQALDFDLLMQLLPPHLQASCSWEPSGRLERNYICRERERERVLLSYADTLGLQPILKCMAGEQAWKTEARHQKKREGEFETHILQSLKSSASYAMLHLTMPAPCPLSQASKRQPSEQCRQYSARLWSKSPPRSEVVHLSNACIRSRLSSQKTASLSLLCLYWHHPTI